MSQRRKFNSSFKFKVVVDALSERLALHELAKKYDLHPNQISSWKKEFLEKGSDIFGREKITEEKKKMLISSTKSLVSKKWRLIF